jgi:hypothetical protein
MPYSAGSAPKFGGRYEDRWTAHCAMLVLAEKASSIYLEEPGQEKDGYEFSLETPEGTEYHQVKRQKAREGRWTTAALKSAGVLDAIRRRMGEAGASFVFVSTHSAYALEELSQRALASESFGRFAETALRSEKWRGEFEALSKAWGEQEGWTWEALRRIRIETISERKLSDVLAFQAELLLAGAGEPTSDVLIGVLREAVNHQLHAANIWSALNKKGRTPNPATSESLATVALQAANDRFKRSRAGSRFTGKLLLRQETQEVGAALKKRSIVLVQGNAGMGKSEVLSELIEGLDGEGVPYLALRLDRLQPSSTAAQLGHDLGLAASPQVTLSAAAAGRQSYLIVDQLDAISTTSGRNPQFLDAVEEMLSQALAQGSIKVVLSCRSFDATNDARLRRLFSSQDEPNSVDVGPLAEEQIFEVLSELGVDKKLMDKGLVELLAIPLHLALFSQIPRASEDDLRRLRTLRDLYDAFWDAKQDEVARSLQGNPNWTDVIDALVDRMSEEQALEAPRETVDSWKKDVDAMLSSAVLVAEKKRLAFIHETFFDYAFARRFSARRRTLKSLLSDDQFLFRRAQVRQILAHMRDGGELDYEQNLRYLMEEESVRFHLKELVIAWLGTVSGPQRFEWDLLDSILQEPSNPLQDRAWQALCSPEWFVLLEENGRLARWLSAGGTSEERGLEIVAAAGAQNARAAAALLSERQSATDRSDGRLESVLLRSDLAGSRELFDLFLEEIARDADLSRRDFWYLAHDLPEKRPEWACELLGTYLRSRLSAGDLIDEQHGHFWGVHLEPRGLHLGEFVQTAAAGAPVAYIEYVWPEIVKIVKRTARPAQDYELRQDAIWNQRHLSSSMDDLEDDLLIGTETAMTELAIQKPSTFVKVAEEFAETDLESIVYFLFQGYAANPDLADPAIQWVASDRRLFRVGYSNGSHWGTRRLLEAVSGHSSDAALEELEEPLLSYYTSWERSAKSHGFELSPFGLEQFALLGGVAKDRRTPAMQKRFAEFQRKFRVADLDAPRGMRGGMVTSPIPDSSAEKMNDANWLHAMECYPSDERSDRKDWLKGGAFQLANVLENLAKANPGRFARLGTQMPDDANTSYFDAILRGVGASDSGVSVEEAHELVERCHRLPGRPCGRWIAHPLRQHATSGIPHKTLRILCSYAVNGQGPSDGSMESDRSAEDQLISRGLNSVRGGLANELASWIYDNPAHIAPVEDTLRKLVKDESDAVRAMAAEAVFWLLRHNTKLAMELFVALTEDVNDAVLSTRYVRKFLVNRATEDFERLAPLLERMISSDLEEVRSDGAAQATLAGLGIEVAQPLADSCMAGSAELRLGAARVFASNLQSSRFRARCEKGLATFFNDEDVSVREAAAGAIRELPDDVPPFIELMNNFLNSQAFEEHGESLIFALENASTAPVALSVATSRRMLDLLEAPSDVTRRDARIAHEVSELLIRAYVDASDHAVKNEVLDVIEQGLALNVYGAHQVLLEHDRG